MDDVIRRLKEDLAVKDAEALFVYSGFGEWRFLDVLSPKGGKLSAMRHVREKLGFDTDQTVACGDSGNDIAMMEGEEHAIIVGNAQKELVEWYDQNNAINHGQKRLYRAKGQCADAIVEGLREMKFIVDN